MKHKRVIPRDFFNEAKLLKCLGHFQICITDHKCNGLDFSIEYDGESFDIRQSADDGTLSCLNYRVYLNGAEMELFTPYNSKDTYPLYGRYMGTEYSIFDDDGRFTFTGGIE